MFTSSKPLASLSSGLLARKGQARPAMRPQGFHGHGMNLDDLGWNDMGEETPEGVVTALSPSAAPVTDAAGVPPVLIERELLQQEISAANEVPVKPVSINTAKRIQREVKACKPRAAFTLRLDADRHLRLRLASATRNRSAQALVIQAVDSLLQSLPEVEELARQLPALTSVRSSGGKR